MSIPKQTHSVYEFGPFRIDVDNRLLLRDGTPVLLAPKVWDALYLLVENSGRVLEKEELMNRLWPDCFVEEGNLTQIIFQLRKALGERAAKQQYIETIPKRGYRFIAGLRKVNGEFGESPTKHIGTPFLIEETPEKTDEKTTVNGNDEVAPARQEFSSQVDHPRQPAEIEPSQPQPRVRHYRKRVAIACAIISVLVGVAISFAHSLRWNPLRAGSRAPFEKMQIRKLTSSGKALRPALSPDGKFVAYVLDEAGRQSIWVRQVNSTSNMQVVPPAEVEYSGVTFSPDGSFIYYVVLEEGRSKGTLFQVPVLSGTPRKILDWVDSTITFSPDGKRFAFVRKTAELKETFLMIANADGSGEQQLAARKMPDFFSATGPAWSPDGKMIASAAGRSSPGNFYMYVVTVNVANGSEARLGSQTWNSAGATAWLKDGSGVVVTAWHLESPVYANQIWYLSFPKGEVSRVTNNLNTHEGTSIAAHADELVTGKADRVSRLWVAPNGDGNRARLIRSVYGDNYSERFGLYWTPDGRLVYGSHASGSADIWIMDPDGSNQKQLTSDARREIDPVVTNDGRYIVYVSQGSGASYLWRMDADGRNPRQLTYRKADRSPSLSPNGQWVVYSSLDESGIRTLWKVSIDGDQPVQLTHQFSDFPVVSPNGKLIACDYRDEQAGRLFITLLPFDGGEPIKVFNEMPLPAGAVLRWTPDGRALTYIVTKDGVSNIWLQPLDGPARQLTHFTEDQIFRLAWSLDGKSLAFDRGMTIKDIVLISDFR